MHGLNLETHGEAAYRLYDKEGTPIAYEKTIDLLAEAEVVLFGELHDNALIHHMQISMTEDLFKKRKGELILGAEMFDSDNQLILDEYLAGLILHRHLVAEAKVWDNYEEDYSALVDFQRSMALTSLQQIFRGDMPASCHGRALRRWRVYPEKRNSILHPYR